MNPSHSAQQANLDLVAQVGAFIGTGFADPDEDLFAPDFVFHFFNPADIRYSPLVLTLCGRQRARS